MWNCPKCREEVEDSFDVCWNCGTASDGTEDPYFGREDVPSVSNSGAASENADAITAHPKKAATSKRKLIVTTGNEVEGRTIVEYLGIVRGIVVRAPGIAQGFLGGLQMIVGGNIEPYEEVCEAARAQAFERMVEHALDAGADAIIGIRYDATEFSQGVTEVLVYGTAVKLAGS